VERIAERLAGVHPRAVIRIGDDDLGELAPCESFGDKLRDRGQRLVGEATQGRIVARG
jgi:hypothetical protein